MPSDAEILRAYHDAKENKTAAANALGMARSTFRSRLRSAQASQGVQSQHKPTGPTGDIRYYPHLQTQEEAIREAGLDPDLYDVARVSSWEAQTPDGIQRLCSLRVVPKSEVVDVLESIEKAIAGLEGKGPRYSGTPSRRVDSGINYEIMISDHHFGKLCWAPETGRNYDLDIASKYYLDATASLLDQQKHDAEQITAIVGNDLFHSDSPLGVTAKSGNVLDMDGRQDNIMDIALETVVASLDQCLQCAPRLSIIMVPGNHDEVSVKWLGRVLDAWYRFDDRVTVDMRPAVRKYYRWGKVLRGFRHGHTGKKSDWLKWFMDECDPHDLSECRWRIATEGHVHHRTVASFGKTMVETVDALCPPDFWHGEAGYSEGDLAATAFEYHRDFGRIAEIFFHIHD